MKVQNCKHYLLMIVGHIVLLKIIQIIFHLNSSAGTGCLVISVETAARRKAKVVGKPERIMFDCINSR